MPLTKNPIQTETKYLAPTNPCHDWLNRLQLKRTGLVGEVVFDLIVLHIGNRLLLKPCSSSTQIVVPDVSFLNVHISYICKYKYHVYIYTVYVNTQESSGDTSSHPII